MKKSVELKKELEEKLPHLNFVFSKPHYLECLNKEVNKGLAIKELLKKYESFFLFFISVFSYPFFLLVYRILCICFFVLPIIKYEVTPLFIYSHYGRTNV